MTNLLKTILLGITFVATTNLAYADNKVGKKTYDQVCSACHASGAAGAPVFGDLSAWSNRIKKGKAALYNSAMNGKGAMPARGGNSSLSDAVIKATVDYMVENSSSL